MPLVAAKCTECGSSIEVDDTKEAGICAHCGTAFITEKVVNNYTNHYNVTNNVTKIYNGGAVEDGEDFFNKGITYLNLKRYDFARQSFDKAIKKNPEVAKYYLYWAVAASKNFSNFDVFFNLCRYFEDDETHDIHDFFELVSKEEADQYSQEFNIDFTHGEKVAKLQILDRVLENNQMDNVNIDLLYINFTLNYLLLYYKNYLYHPKHSKNRI